MARDLHPARLGTTNEDGSRAFVYKASVDGFWHKRRTIVHALLVVIFLVCPWLRYSGEQLIFLDVVHRRFVLFGHIFWAHDVPIMFLLLVSVFLTILFATAVWGRVWCGWACPQTVFIDGVFRRIDRWIEGTHLERKRLDEEPVSFRKIGRKSLKWTLFALVSAVIAHSFMAYFAGSRELMEMMARPPSQNWGYFLVVLFLEAVLLFDFGWFREQFCVIVCPYGRMQSILMDTRTITVLYDQKRGEPRKGTNEPGQAQGDCVNCFRCVQVCPTGIDIRRGVQLECINCTACIDACDEVMEKIKRPKGLIRFDSLVGRANQKRWSARSLLYMGSLLAAVSGLIFVLSTRSPLDVVFIRGRGEPYTVIQEQGQDFVMNLFHVQVSSQTNEDLDVEFAVSPELAAMGVQLTTPFRPLLVKVGEIKRTEVFLRFPKTLLKNGVGSMSIDAVGKSHGPPEAVQEKNRNQQEVHLVGPFS